MSDEPGLHVSGGVGGVDARYEDIELLAHHSEQLSIDLAAIAGECHAMLVHPDVVASAVLNPLGVAQFERALLAALDGREGLSALAFTLGADAIALRTAAASYRALDEAQAQLIDAVRWSAGELAGLGLPLVLSNPVTAPLAAGGLFALFAAGETAGVDPQRVLTDHPGVVDNLVGMGPGFLSGLPGPLVVSDVPSGARVLGMLYPDGSAVVTDRGMDFDPTAATAPRGFEDLLDGLGHRNAAAKGDNQGQIDIRVVTHKDGRRAYIVDIPGTRDWHLMPGQEYDKLTDLGTNLHAMGGEQTSYEQGIIQALHRAGADDGSPIMLVGHSQGGIVAAEMAHDLAGTEYNVTHVVTAGSPIGRIDIPDDVQVLSLENEHDIVPHLDAADNPDRPNQVTVSFDSQYGTIGDNHNIERSYVPAAQAVDSSTDPSLLAHRDSANAFFASKGGQATTEATAQVYQVTRG
jgi:PGAP1-like protein